MADKKKRAPPPPSSHGSQTGGSVREINNPAYVEVDGLQQAKKPTLPLPDYETLFPQKRHGVQGHTRWDHIIAEVNQRNRVTTPEFLGPEMSVDGPEEHRPDLRSSHTQESPAVRHYQTQEETKPVSTKRVAAPAPPKSVPPPNFPAVADSSQRQSQYNLHQSALRPNPAAVPGHVSSEAASRESLSVISRDGARKVLQPPPAATPAPKTVRQPDRETATPDDQSKAQVAANKEAPTAKPRQRASGKDLAQQEEGNIQTLSSSSMDKKGSQAKENFAEFDPFPSTDLLSKDPWDQLKQSRAADDLFTGSTQKEKKLDDWGMTTNDLDNIFNQERLTDSFAGFNGGNSSKHSDHEETDDASPAFQRRNSQRQKPILPPTTLADSKTFKSWQELSYKEESKESNTATPQADVKTPGRLNAQQDPFGAEPFPAAYTSTSSESLHVVMEEPEAQGGGLSGGKTPLRAWVSPSEAQPVSAQTSIGGGLALSARRPHPVKPMSSVETQHPVNTPAVKELKVRDSAPGRIQAADSVQSGPYTQLTQEELITLVVKQQTDLSRKDAKIVELEEYIDNLLVRVIDEKPSILQSLTAAKPV